jgi:hypothetical protein
MAEPTAPRLRVTFAVTRADTGRFVLACDPLASESAPVIPGSDPTASDAALAASDPTETEAVIRGGVVKLTLVLAQLLACMAYSPHERATTNHPV